MAAIESYAVETVTLQDCHAWLSWRGEQQTYEGEADPTCLRCSACPTEIALPRWAAFTQMIEHIEQEHRGRARYSAKPVLTAEQRGAMESLLREHGYEQREPEVWRHRETYATVFIRQTGWKATLPDGQKIRSSYVSFLERFLQGGYFKGKRHTPIK
jgi:hypothetical protein